MSMPAKYDGESRTLCQSSQASRDPAKRRLHHIRVLALIVLGAMALIFAVIIALAAISGHTAGSGIQPWFMP